MKKKIRCYFTDFWPNFDYKSYFAFLWSEYELIIDKENPDYLFYSCFGNSHILYNNCIKIFWSGENLIPDLNLCDYAVCLSDLQYGDRVFHFYLCLFFRGRDAVRFDLKPEQLLNRKFCNFVYSNSGIADPYRERVFKELSRYKRIDSGGGVLNNMGYRVDNKHLFLKDYKFTLSIENSSLHGYITEKIYEPFLAQSLPIYWGDPNVSSYYNTNSFVNLMNYSSMEEAIEEIIRLDNDDAAYLEKVMAPFWPYGDSFEEFYDSEMNKMMAFFRNIFDQPLSEAVRRTEWGNVRRYLELMREHYHTSPETALKRKYKTYLKKIVKTMIRK